MHHPTTLAAAAALLVALPGLALAAAGPASLDSTTTPYTQDFNTLSSASTSFWTTGSTLKGWYASAALLNGSAGSSATTGFYSFGATGAVDRALGSITGAGAGGASGANRTVTFGITNNTGSALSAFSLSWDSEVWRNAGATKADTEAVAYSFGSSVVPGPGVNFVSPGVAFNATAPVQAGTAAATDGNAAAWRQAGLGGTVNLATPWATGSTLWLRWTDEGVVNNGMAIDNVILSATAVSAVPEPQTYALMLAGLAGVRFVARRRHAG